MDVYQFECNISPRVSYHSKATVTYRVKCADFFFSSASKLA